MDERIFDISKPHKTKPDHTGKPIIVGHHPQMPDPMIRKNAPDKPKVPSQPEFGPPSEGNPLGLPPLPEKPKPETADEPLLSAEPLPSFEAPKQPVNPPPALSNSADQSAGDRSADEPPINPPIYNKATGQTVEPTPTDWKPEYELPIAGKSQKSANLRKKISLVVLVAVFMAIGLYILLQTSLIKI